MIRVRDGKLQRGLGERNRNSLKESSQRLDASRSEYGSLTSEWLRETWTFEIFLESAATLASPRRTTSGTPSVFGRISMSFIAAPAPLDDTPSDLKTASLPAHRAAKDAAGFGWDWQ